MHAGADDYWDGNWLVTPIEMVAGGFRASAHAGLRAEELKRFSDELQQVHASLTGEATLESMEEWLTLKVDIDERGRLDVTGTVIDRPGSGNRLSFRIDGLDQADLPPIVNALEHAQTLFPVVGNP